MSIHTCIYILRGIIEPPQGTKLFCWLVLGSRMQSDCWSGFNRRRRCMRMPRLWSIAHLHLQKSHDLSDFMMLWLRNFVTWSLHHLIWPAGPWVLVLQMTIYDSCVKKQIENLPNEVWRCGGHVSCSSNLCFHGRVMLSLPKHIRKIP